MTTINYNPVLDLTPVGDTDLLSLQLAFGKSLPWLVAVLEELQTGRDSEPENQDDLIEELNDDIRALRNELAARADGPPVDVVY